MLTKTERLVCTCVALAGASLTGRSAVAQDMLERRSIVMGTELLGRVVLAEQTAASDGLTAAFRAVKRVDDLLSTWRSEAALSRANAAPVGERIQLDPALASWLSEVWVWTQRTGATFDPSIGALITAWDLRGEGRVPDPGPLAAARRASGPDGLSFSPTERSFVRHDSLSWLDSGAFGKGAGLRAAEQALRAAGIANALLNFGGQVVAMGHDATGHAWRVSVAHPTDRHGSVAVLRVTDGSVATTSQSERFIVAGGDTLGHVLDPRSGRPVPAWGSVTVVHHDPLVADVLSTALFVMGPDAGLAWLDGWNDVAVLFVIRRGVRVEARWNPPMDSLLTERAW